MFNPLWTFINVDINMHRVSLKNVLERTDEATEQLEKDGRTKSNVHRLPTDVSTITTSPGKSQEILNTVHL